MISTLKTADLLLIGWIAISSLYTFVIFGADKARSRQTGKTRISEMHLLFASALGGFWGGFAAMLLFRHKTAKTSFLLKFFVALLGWLALVYACWKTRRFLD